MAEPWLKFYTTDWQADPALRLCSLAARGLWVEMICLMHEATPYGHLLVNGQSPADAQLAVLAGTTPDQITALLGELESAGVFSRTRTHVIYSRKLTRMAKKAATARNNGRRGGNPSLSNERHNPASDKGPLKGGDKPQKPEARSQIREDANASSARKAKPERFTEFWDSFPHRSGAKKDRKAALAKYARAVASGVPEQAIIEAAQRYQKDAQVQRGYGKGPVPWLNGECWNDEIEDRRLSAINGGQHGGEPSRGEERTRAFIVGARGAG